MTRESKAEPSVAKAASPIQVITKTMITHTVTYFVMGLIASTLLDYRRWFEESRISQFMRSTADPWVMAGPLFQPVRGVFFGLVFYTLREPFFGEKRGWLSMWAVLLVLGIVNTFGPTPGSIEGMIYTTLPLADHLRGLPEVVLQSFVLSLVVFQWVNHPEKRWLKWVMCVGFALVLALPTLGLLVGRQG